MYVEVEPDQRRKVSGRVALKVRDNGEMIFPRESAVVYFDPADAIVPDRCDGNEWQTGGDRDMRR